MVEKEPILTEESSKNNILKDNNLTELQLKKIVDKHENAKQRNKLKYEKSLKAAGKEREPADVKAIRMKKMRDTRTEQQVKVKDMTKQRLEALEKIIIENKSAKEDRVQPSEIIKPPTPEIIKPVDVPITRPKLMRGRTGF